MIRVGLSARISYILAASSVKTRVPRAHTCRCCMHQRSRCIQCEWCLHWWYLSVRPIRVTVMIPTRDSMKILRSNVMRFDEIYSISALDFALYCIIISVVRIVNGYSLSSLWSVFSFAASLGRYYKIARLRYSFMSRISYDPCGMTISLSSSPK